VYKKEHTKTTFTGNSCWYIKKKYLQIIKMCSYVSMVRHTHNTNKQVWNKQTKVKSVATHWNRLHHHKSLIEKLSTC